MDIVAHALAFVKSQQEAEARGEQEFTCPLCGARAKWTRAPENNHLHCGCSGCGMKIME